MGYVEDETREKQRADLRELGGTLREFAELEARRRNWGPAQRRLGLAMSAWQFFVIRRRHGRFLAKERARLRALGLGPPEAPPPAASDDDGGDDEPARAALPLPSWEWYTSLRSTHGSSWGRAPRLSQYPSWSGPATPARRKGKRSRGVRWAPRSLPPWMRPQLLAAAPPPAQSPAAPSPRAKKVRGAPRPPKIPRSPTTPKRPRTVSFDGARGPDPPPSPSRFPALEARAPASPDRASASTARAPASPDRASASTASVRAPRTASTSLGSPLSSYRKLAPRVGRDDPDGDFKDLAHDKFAVYALTWPPKRAAGFHRAGRKAFGAAANRVNNRKTILAAGSFSTVEYVTKTSTSPRGREARVTLKPADDFDRVVAA
ncbi:hypothetical protein AURANDRAFT_65236 [Aureococcus anophagefferens]|uniref:Uncharacterized protein n=1 Tax=Aureococcus anophagefferens TaxID=44056 RepID=F0YD69_AURAN|nr:hypothetical protein AURANDRAFT_65236 [Aureococcus anophagefferens]EGB07005.1 hypothetical protein AURANDRAFT_65236 [Aureococcus anophagefferens]|eukprot:XP_009038245.1 hypothetical protein AURANDRAFT_65236 [Aureococcus anophagefferens]